MSHKHDYMARRLNFDEEEADSADNSVIDLCLSSDEDADEGSTDDIFNDFINLDDTGTFSGSSLLETLLPFEPLAEVEDFEPTTPPPTPTSLDHTIMYGEGMLQ
jgi:hypothetical protein